MVRKSLLSICFILLFGAGSVMAADFSKPQELVEQSVIVLKKFGADSNFADFQALAMRAKALFIIPKMLKGGFIVGGSGGSGVLVSRDIKTGGWSYPVFYSMATVSIGMQIGAEAAEMVLLVMTDRGLDSMLSTSFKLGADVSVAAGPVGRGAKAATADILSFSMSKGAYGGASVEGAVIKTRDKWNETYYGKRVSPADVVIRKTVSNVDADSFRQVVRDVANGPVQ